MKIIKILVVLSTLMLTPLAMANENIKAIEIAANNVARSEANIARDKYRNPVETLHFFEVTPTSTVVEIAPGSGWYTEILAPLLADKGLYYAAHAPADTTSDFHKRALANFKEKLSANPIYSKVQLSEFAPNHSHNIAPTGSVDVVLTFRNLHNWYGQGGDAAMVAIFKDFYKALKPGGVFGVVEHRLPANQTQGEWLKSGYFPQDLAIKLATEAGFIFEASSEINANPKDTADYPNGVWTLPPSLRLKEQDKEKYLAIGESDRMTLKFRKPLN